MSISRPLQATATGVHPWHTPQIPRGSFRQWFSEGSGHQGENYLQQPCEICYSRTSTCYVTGQVHHLQYISVAISVWMQMLDRDNTNQESFEDSFDWLRESLIRTKSGMMTRRTGREELPSSHWRNSAEFV